MIRLRPAGFGATRLRLCGAAASVVRARLCLAALFVLIGGCSTSFACEVCFQADVTSIIEGTMLGILALLGVTLSVQGAFVGFFIYLRRRAKRIGEIELDTEWSDLQRGASRT